MRASEVEINRTKERAKEQCILKIALVQWARNQGEFGKKKIYIYLTSSFCFSIELSKNGVLSFLTDFTYLQLVPNKIHFKLDINL